MLMATSKGSTSQYRLQRIIFHIVDATTVAGPLSHALPVHVHYAVYVSVDMYRVCSSVHMQARGSHVQARMRCAVLLACMHTYLCCCLAVEYCDRFLFLAVESCFRIIYYRCAHCVVWLQLEAEKSGVLNFITITLYKVRSIIVISKLLLL